jgi:hypothetical protein
LALAIFLVLAVIAVSALTVQLLEKPKLQSQCPGLIETLDTAIDLHEYQLQQLSYGEFIQASERAHRYVSSTGGQVVHVEGLHA